MATTKPCVTEGGTKSQPVDLGMKIFARSCAAKIHLMNCVKNHMEGVLSGVTPVVIWLVNFSNKFTKGSAVKHAFHPGVSREQEGRMDNMKGNPWPGG
jgi:hypothetical protein